MVHQRKEKDVWVLELGEGRSSKDLGLELGFDFKWRESGDGGLGGKNVPNKG